MKEITKLRKTRKCVFETREAYHGVKENGADYKNSAANHLKGVPSITTVLMGVPSIRMVLKGVYSIRMVLMGVPSIRMVLKGVTLY